MKRHRFALTNLGAALLVLLAGCNWADPPLESQA